MSVGNHVGTFNMANNGAQDRSHVVDVGEGPEEGENWVNRELDIVRYMRHLV